MFLLRKGDKVNSRVNLESEEGALSKGYRTHRLEFCYDILR